MITQELNECSDYSCIFNLVKRSVEITIQKRRVGLMLGISDLPIHIGALHQVGSNIIVINKKLLEAVVQSSDRKLVNAFLFHILLHEYLHSLGFLNENDVRVLTYAVSEAVLGENHPSTLMAKHGIGSVFPHLNILPREDRREIEIISNFENDNLSYFG